MMNNLKDVLFLGYAVSSDLAEELKGASVAGNKMQTNILSRLNKEVNLSVITVQPMARYPLDNFIVVRKKRINICDGVIAESVGFLNVPLLKPIMQMYNCKRMAEKYVKMHPSASIVVFNMFPQVGNAAVYLKKKYQVPVVTILADPPIDEVENRRLLASVLRKIYYSKTEQNLRIVDKVIALNKHAWRKYSPQANCMIMEGGVDTSSEYLKNTKRISGDFFCDKKRHIVYAGSLAEYSGVRELVYAMRHVNADDVVLDIYGDGALNSWITEKCDDRILFHGKISNDEMLKIMVAAWILISPRPTNTPIAQTTFPSKIFEYLMSGTPVLSTRLNGFTEEYSDKMFWIEKNDADGIANAINSLTCMSKKDLESKAEKARNFVVNNKSWDKQVRRMVDFIGAPMNCDDV